MIDSDFAQLYGVTTKRLNEQVKRNSGRFPNDFMFQLTRDETEILKSQNATSSKGHGGRRYLPYAFTEHGTVMLASVLNSAISIEANIYIVRAFIKLRELLSSQKEIAIKLRELEHKIAGHDEDIQMLFLTLRNLMSPQTKEKIRIGFHNEIPKKDR